MNNMISNVPRERSTVTYSHTWWDKAFTDDELTKIIGYCDDIGTERAHILGTDKSDADKIEKVRRCDIKFHHRNENTAWIFDKLNNVITSLNNQFYGFDLNGYDAFQYTSYNSAESGEYGWHMDTCMGGSHLPTEMIEPRKLSLTFLLNDPVDDFDGGKFQINGGNEHDAETLDIPKGRIIAFPSFMLHRITPVTRGFRKSIVVWVVGPKFR